MLSIFRRIKTEYTDQNIEKWEIIGAILNILINRIEHISSTNKSKVYPKYKQAFKIMNDFMDLVEQSFATEKFVSFYADKLNITKNHLTETIRNFPEKPLLIRLGHGLYWKQDESYSRIKFEAANSIAGKYKIG